MQTFHQQIISEIKKLSGLNDPNNEGFGLKYVGTNKPSYHLNTHDTRLIAKNFVRSHEFNLEDFTDLLNSLYKGKTYDEVTIAAKIIEFSPEFKAQFDLNHLYDWLGFVCGWAETDTLCQMAFSDTDLFLRWPEWKKLLQKLNSDSNIHRRRASLVLLTKPVRLSDDKRILELALKNTDNLKNEKDILITKAVSWILRSLTKNHPEAVANYLEKNRDSLPKIAIRETTTKLLTGKKYIRPKTEY
jgi:3-methyladenine DNA glycosylase AlkD